MKNTTILYHENCCDGFTSAWLAWKYFGDDAEYLPVSYGGIIPDTKHESWEQSIYILDFSFSREILEEYASLFHKVVVLDHHKTAEEELGNLGRKALGVKEDKEGLFTKFDSTKSGAMLTWQYFYSQIKPPNLVKYVEDRDLWHFRLQDSKQINAAIQVTDKTFKAWDELSNEDITTETVKRGTAILVHTNFLVKQIASQSFFINFPEHLNIPCVNTSILFSEVGDYLCKFYFNSPFTATYFDRADGMRQWSLRSRGDFDCSKVAKQYGGGGHKGAAGFVTKHGYIIESDFIPGLN